MGDKLDPKLCRELAKRCADLRCPFESELLDIAVQLTAAAEMAERPTLTEERVREVVLEIAKDEADGFPIIACAIASRAAKELAGAVVDPAQRDRIVTIADEAFGLGPVESLEETLNRLERGIFEQHKRLANMEVQREAELREAWITGAQWHLDTGPDVADEPNADDIRDDAAAEYARSKAGRS